MTPAEEKWLAEKTRAFRLLLIDDDSLVRILMKRYLSQYHVEITECSNGTEALQLFSVIKFDGIFLDLVLPGMGGLEVLEKMREKEPTVPIAIISGYLDSYNMNKAMDLGCSTFIRKPAEFNNKAIEVLMRAWQVRKLE